MSWAHVQTAGTFRSTVVGNSTTHASTGAVGSGSLLVCFAGWTGFGNDITSLTSSPANTWSTLGAYNDGNFGLKGFYAANVASGITTVTATWASTAITFATIALSEISGIATASPLDASTGNFQSAPGTGANGITSNNPGNTANNNELAIGAVLMRNSGGNVTAGTSPNTFTERFEVDGTFYELQIQTANVATAGSAGTGTATASNDVNTTSMVATFKEPAASGSGPTRGTLLPLTGVAA